MKPFESYLLIERWKTEGRTLAFLIFYTPVFFAWQAEREEVTQPAAATEPAAAAEQEDYENEKIEEALTAYNSGRPGKSQYADSVIARMGSFTGEVA